ncbi:heme ABC transporter ATP-binding protein [Chryseolinea sp. H1M3-3]|uniref:heme ABC transporter ATP-binding protein n=1 Tax=Chryseolinea sp. H1M3-3 TaxID=3034144 RepID=UPI0023EC870D|nr:heme ABC transporter ATP-binding protein [Chryseolinea sp. H1M3-3]
MYEAIDISLRAGQKHILKNVFLSIQPGHLVAIVGPNGAGKSSLLKIISNEKQDYCGNVVINGTWITSYKTKELSAIRAVMAQHSNLQFAFSVRQVVALARHAHRSSSDENHIIVEEVMDITGVSKFAERNYLTLSGGEKQRVQFARVLAQVWGETLYPRYILLDEPTSSMDIAQQQSMFGIIKKICSRNIGVLAIVHDLNLAVQFADQICMMRNGEVIESGHAHEVFTKNNIEKTFYCKVNIFYDPCTNCPFIIPDAEQASFNRIAITT